MSGENEPIPLTSRRKPPWIRSRLPHGERYEHVRGIVRASSVSTVCEMSRCPNLGSCWGEGTVTFMVMGAECTRGCRFCHVGRARAPDALAHDEPVRLAGAVAALKLSYVVVTSVDRDDLEDQGAAHLAACVSALAALPASPLVELLLPDLGGREERLRVVAAAGADVLAHNVETVERLTPRVRDRRARYRLSLAVLEALKRGAPRALTKSSLMLGLGERDEEIERALADVRGAGVDIVTIGQYLQPSARHLPVARWYTPAELDDIGALARSLGFAAVAAGPLVRSSFDAQRLHREAASRIRINGSGA